MINDRETRGRFEGLNNNAVVARGVPRSDMQTRDSSKSSAVARACGPGDYADVARVPSASVIVATYSRPQHVRTCLHHLALQSLAPKEIVVVDASPDPGTRNVVAEFKSVLYLRNDRGAGHTATSRAIGVAATTGDVVVFLDDDAYAAPSWLAELLVRYLDPTVAAVGGRALNGQPGEATEGVSEIGLLLPSGKLTGFFAADPGRDVDVDHMLGANMSLRRAVLDQLGGIHDHYPGTCLREETDIALRARRAGYRIVYTPSAVVEHVAGPYARGRRFDTRYHYYAARNHLVLLAETLGVADIRTLRYLLGTARDSYLDLKSAASSLKDPFRRSLETKLRGMAGGLLRAGTRTVGTAAGISAVAALRSREGLLLI